MDYNFSDIEREVKEFWKKHDVYRVELDRSKPKYYALDFFPYPSGAGLHVGHPLGYIACDIYARYKRLKGFNVLHPMGFDSFGLPAEQYAIQTGQHPAITTDKNIQTFKEQLDKIGFSFDWSREIRTSDPSFYKWTQWIFIKFFHSWYNKKTDKAEPIDSLIKIFEQEGTKNVEAVCGELPFHSMDDPFFSADDWKNFSAKEKSDTLLSYRIAYIADSWVNWCPALGTVLANDEVKDGVSERGGYPVERKLMKQWSLRITAYAERLLKDLEKIDWSEAIKESQRNWIGKSEGCSIEFRISPARLSHSGGDLKFRIEVFTTRPDTIFGATFITLAPEHELVQKIATPEYKKQVDEYVAYAKNRSERERMTDIKKITGQFTGAHAIHPFSGKQLPIWIGEYVLATYGTGAVMGVPGHDERDNRFATYFGLPVISIIEGVDVTEKSFDEKEGIVCNSDFLNGLSVPDAIKKALEEIEKKGIGKRKVNYKMRDAIFGRQRYWGEPIPIYYDEKGIPHTVDENDLPLVLPEVDKYLPTESGEPPLARAKDWYYSPGNDPSLTLPEGERTPAQKIALSESEVSSFGGDLEEVTKPGYITADEKTYRHIKELPKEFRQNSTDAEKALWQELRGDKLGDHFRRQHVIGNFIVDFACLKKKLIVEVDGGIHLSQIEEDKAREEELQKLGFNIIRFKNEKVLEKMPEVLLEIKRALSQSNPSMPLPEGERKLSREGEVLPFGEDLGGVGKREKKYPLETTTMPGWAGSNWYYLRYEDPDNENELASKEAIDYWQNVDLYLGGDEHATGHLMYFRFCTKFLFDFGIVPFDEPVKKLVNQGKIQGVSSKVYKINRLNFFRRVLNFDNEIFLSKNVADMYLRKEISDEDLIERIKKSADFDIEIGELIPLKNPASPSSAVSKMNINIEWVKNNILEIDAFQRYNEENRRAILVREDSGEFISDEEVEKMSKSKYNVVNPDEVVEKYGADVFRMYEMFLGPLEQSKPWDTKGIDGVFRFLKKLWKLFFDEEGKWMVNEEAPTKDELKILHRTIKKAGDDIEEMSFNTSVSAFMICVNELTQLDCHKKKILEPMLIMMSPFAPFITESLWQKLGNTETIVKASFPKYDASLLVETSFEYPVAVNGKTRVRMNFDLDLPSEQIEKEVISAEALQKYFDGKTPKKVIVVKGRMINVVV